MPVRVNRNPIEDTGRGFSMYGKTSEELRAHVTESARRVAYARATPTVLRAAGVRIEPMSSERLRALAGHRQPWQSLAWGYRDMIGELRFALQFRARNISRVKIYVAQVDPNSEDDEPLPVALRHDKDPEKAARITLSEEIIRAAEAELDRLPLGDGYGFLGVWSENFDVAGECYLYGSTDRYTGEETWAIRSIDDVDIQGASVTVKDELGQPRKVDLENEELYRLWVPHPRKPHLADSALNAVMDVLEDITLIGRELRAAARSRIMANGVWLIPDGMARVKNTTDDTEDPEDASARFIADLTAAMLAPISNEGDAGAVVPIVLTGSRDDIETAKSSYIRFEREDSPTLLAKLDKALSRMATSLDIPPEILTGMAEVNHWTAWQIDAATFKQYMEPSIRIMVDSLTAAMLRAALEKQGFPPEEIARIRYWYNGDSITENPNRRQDALDARDHLAISDKAFRDALGFNESDAPTPEEIMLMVAGRNGFDQAAAAKIMQWAVQQAGGDAPPLPEVEAAPEPRQVGPSAPPRATADPSGVGGQGAPASAPPAVNAAGLLADLSAYADQGAPGRPLWRMDATTGRRLMEVDRALRGRLLDAADAALARASERAGSRLRAKATRDPAIRASLGQYSVTNWPARMGRDQAYQLGADSGFLLAKAWEELSEKFARWVLSALDRIVPGVLKLAGYDPASEAGKAAGARMRDEMAGRVPAAWDHLQARLDELADRVIFEDQAEFDLEGEIPDIQVPPYLVRAALAEVGGLPETSGGLDAYGRPVTGEPANGLYNGSTVSAVLEDAGVATIGYLWVYGITPMRNQFEPHAELEGARFTSWRDPKLDTSGTRYEWVGPYFRPGDHRGCMCDFVPGYAVPDYAAQVRERLAVPTAGMAEVIALAEADDAAGRRGTTAQEARNQHAEIQRLQARFLDGD